MEKVKLGEIALLINGDRGKNYPSQEDITDDGEVPFVNAGHLNGKNIDYSDMNYISKEKYEKLSSGKFEKGDILYCLRGSLGKKAIVNDEVRGAIASSLVIIRPDRKKVNGDYLMFSLDAPTIREQLTKANNGSTQPNLSASSVREFRIELPTLLVQEDVVEKLTKLQHVIEKRQNQINLLDKLVKARFVEMFGNVKTELLLEDISEFITVGIANSATHAYSDSGVPLLRNQNIKENFLDDTDLKYITPEFAKLYESKKLKENDIIAMRTGYPGVCCLVPKKYEGCQTFTTLIIRLKPNNNPVYICNFINSDFAKAFIDSEKVGVAQQNLGAKSLAKMPIIIAPKEKQDIFSEFAKQVDKSKVAVQKSLEETQLLFDKLMQEYFG